jgi:hypothetical protein
MLTEWRLRGGPQQAQAPPPMSYTEAPPTDKMQVTLPPGVVSGQQLQVQVSGASSQLVLPSHKPAS